MKNLYRITAVLLVLFLPAQAKAQLNIVATIPALAQIAKAVAGDDGKVISLAKVGQDPHFVPGKPTLARHLARADLLVSVGLALESGWLPPLVSLSRNTNIKLGGDGYFAGSYFIQVIGHHGKTDRSMGDIHPEGNPHWWLDPIRVIDVAHALAQRMAALDPEHAEAYAHRASVFAAQLQSLVDVWTPQLKQSPNIVTYHDSYRYLAQRFNIKVVGFIEPKPGIEASTRHLDALLELMKTKDVHQIWAESYHLGRVATRIASLSGAKLHELNDAVAGDSAQAYIHMIELMLQAAAGKAP